MGKTPKITQAKSGKQSISKKVEAPIRKNSDFSALMIPSSAQASSTQIAMPKFWSLQKSGQMDIATANKHQKACCAAYKEKNWMQ